MDVAISGATGLLGRALRASLERDGHRVRPLVRGDASRPLAVRWDPVGGSIDSAALEGVDAVVHLAGEGIAAHRWTDEHRRRVHDSRSRGTALLAEALAGLDAPPRVLVSSSAIGYYGDRGDEELTEQSRPGSGFLPQVCIDWEAATGMAAQAGIRVACMRTGIVLASEGGALGKQLLPYKLGLGGPAGDGRQWMSWITIDDHVAAMRFLIDTDVAGPVNLTSPGAVTNKEFARTLGRVLRRPAVVRIPRFVRKAPLGIGPLVDSLLFDSARVRPAVLEAAGFTFRHRTLEPALRAVLGRGEELAA